MKKITGDRLPRRAEAHHQEHTMNPLSLFRRKKPGLNVLALIGDNESLEHQRDALVTSLETTTDLYKKAVQAGIRDRDRIVTLERQLSEARADADKGWAQARGAIKTRDALQVKLINMANERDAAKSLLAAANERAERAEKTLSEARAVALGGDGMTHEQAFAAVVGLIANLRDERSRVAELERLLAHARDTAAENLKAKRIVQGRAFLAGQAYHEQSQRMQAAESRRKAFEETLRKATIRLEILGDRMRACDESNKGHFSGHALSLFEIGGWIEEQRAALSDKLPTGESPKESRQVGEPGQRDARLAAADVGGSIGEVIADSTDPQRTVAAQEPERDECEICGYPQRFHGGDCGHLFKHAYRPAPSTKEGT